MDSPSYLAEWPESSFGGAELVTLTHAAPPPAQLVRPAPAPPVPQVRTGLVTQPRPYAEIARRPPNNGQRLLIPDVPDRVAPGQAVRAMYAAPLTSPTVSSWLGEDCHCPDES